MPFCIGPWQNKLASVTVLPFTCAGKKIEPQFAIIPVYCPGIQRRSFYIRTTAFLRKTHSTIFPSMYSLQPKKGGRLQPREYTQAHVRTTSALFSDSMPMELRGRVMTK